eukprot:PhF_6_TR12256/c0_g1_i1/m.19420/K10733/GINS2, PSF2; GINS complex subunit 2
MDAAKCSFIAQQEHITIVPLFSLDSVSLMCGTFGPFRVHYPVVVPLWLALYFKNAKVCMVRAPPWLTVEHLTAILNEENEYSEFSVLPFYYKEVGALLMERCADDVGPGGLSDVLGRLLGDIELRRWHKVLADLETFKTLGILNAGMRMKNLCYCELQRLRPVMLRIMNDAIDLEALAVVRMSGGGRGSLVSSDRTFPWQDTATSASVGGAGGIGWSEPSLETTTNYNAEEQATTISTTALLPKRRRTLRDI